MKNAEEKRELSDAEKLQMELIAIDTLQQYGFTIRIPLREAEISTLRGKQTFLGRLLGRGKKAPLPSQIEPKMRMMPDPSNPDRQVEYWEGEVAIRPLYLATIDRLRAKRLELELKDPNIKDHLEQLDNADDYMLQYTAEMCYLLAIATLNVDDERKHHAELKQLAEFYRTHLTNSRLQKMVSVVMMMRDIKSFQISTRLILGMGSQTMPREASRVEKKSEG